MWMAISPKHRKPPIDVRVHFVRFSGRALSAAIEYIECFGAPTLRVYSIEKTIADCFKLRTRINPHIAVAALGQALREGRCNLKRLRDFAAICRVARLVDSHLGSLRRTPRPAAR